ncbi:hypothetical protein I7I53_04241 [Histoplasma capsulatum var. duboisii H88]|uniref:Uncharacterized protein n=1 Tax=Ajellomyces capsulatus (strain H88) TaxID=544711 RepID=A0A8A1LP99_AJEC8|nr:hypothetical protein I7I53_04241 [Histoplasma capsulatum var. duboisii H88]
MLIQKLFYHLLLRTLPRIRLMNSGADVRAPITAAAVIVWSSASQEAITFRATRTGAKEVHRQRHAGMRGDEPPNPITPTDRVQFSQPPPAGFDSW